MELVKHTKLCFVTILIMTTINIGLIILHYSIDISKWWIALSFIATLLSRILFHIANKYKPLSTYLKNKWIYRASYLYFIFSVMSSLNLLILQDESLKYNFMFSLSCAIAIVISRNVKSIQLKRSKIKNDYR